MISDIAPGYTENLWSRVHGGKLVDQIHKSGRHQLPGSRDGDGDRPVFVQNYDGSCIESIWFGLDHTIMLASKTLVSDHPVMVALLELQKHIRLAHAHIPVM